MSSLNKTELIGYIEGVVQPNPNASAGVINVSVKNDYRNKSIQKYTKFRCNVEEGALKFLLNPEINLDGALVALSGYNIVRELKIENIPDKVRITSPIFNKIEVLIYPRYQVNGDSPDIREYQYGAIYEPQEDINIPKNFDVFEVEEEQTFEKVIQDVTDEIGLYDTIDDDPLKMFD